MGGTTGHRGHVRLRGQREQPEHGLSGVGPRRRLGNSDVGR